MRILLIGVIVALMVGGGTTQTKYVTRIETVTVYKAVPTVPENLKNIPKVNRPDLTVNHLTPADKTDPDKVARAVVASEAQLRAYIQQLEDNEKAFREYANQPPPELPESTVEVRVESE